MCVSVVSCESPVMARQYQCQTDTSDTVMAGGMGSKRYKERNQLMEGSLFFLGEGEMNRSVFTCRWFWIQIVSGLYVLI